MPERCTGKWYACRKGTRTEAYDYLDSNLYEDLRETGDPNALRNSINVVQTPVTEYLHPDKTWKQFAHYFSTREEIEKLI